MSPITLAKTGTAALRGRPAWQNFRRPDRGSQIPRGLAAGGGVTSELVSGIRGSGPHFGILFPPLTRLRARARAREGSDETPAAVGPMCRRGEPALEMKCRSLQVVLM
jgi:hypothetical protein